MDREFEEARVDRERDQLEQEASDKLNRKNEEAKALKESI